MRIPGAWLITLAAFLGLIPCAGILAIDLDRRAAAVKEVLPVEAYHLPPPHVLRSLCFGYNELCADLLWVRTISYFADHLTSDRDLRYLERHLGNILALDDRFKAIYSFGAAMLVSRGYMQTNSDVLAAIALNERAARIFPDDWHYPFNLGAYYMGYLRSSSKAERERWQRTGADWVRRAALLGANIPWLPNLAARIYTEQGQRDLAIEHLQELYLTSQDPAMKAQIEAKLKSLTAQKQVADLRRAAQELETSMRQSGLSFVPPDLFALIDLPPLRPFSLKDLAGPPGS